MKQKKGTINFIAISIVVIGVIFISIAIISLTSTKTQDQNYKKFKESTDRIKETLSNDPDPMVPDAINPITVSRSSLIIKGGSQTTIKVSMYCSNVGGCGEAHKSTVTCKPNLVTTKISISDIDYEAYATGGILIETTAGKPGTILCTITGNKIGNGGTNHLKDFSVQVMSVESTDGQGDDDCANSESVSTRDWCYKREGIMNNDLASCEKIQSQYSKDDCYHQVGRGLVDLSICDKIQTESFRNFCYSGVARTKEDPSICDGLQTIEGKDICFENVGVGMKDLALCDKINDQKTKDNCYSEVNRLKS